MFEKYKLINYMEIMVRDLLKETIDNFDYCKCSMCQLDIIALALNELPPQYAVSTEGLTYKKLDQLKAQCSIDVVLAITKAAKVIGENPRHSV